VGTDTCDATRQAIADATIREDAPDNNYGDTSSVTAGLSSDGSSLSRALFKFDLSTIPTNATVTNITFSLIELGQPPAQSTFFLSPLLINWVEAEVTWNNRSVGMPWTQPGGDFSAESAFAYLSSGAAGTTNQFTDNGGTPGYGLVADAQSWIGNPARNFGWILTAWPEDTAGSAFQFGSRENPGSEPVLTVGYTVPFTPAMVKVLSTTNANYSFVPIALDFLAGRAQGAVHAATTQNRIGRGHLSRPEPRGSQGSHFSG
jgi:hypothetical protein